MKQMLVIQFFLLLLFMAFIIPLATDASDINEDLLIAAKNGQTSEVWALLDTGANVNAQNENGRTALRRITRGVLPPRDFMKRCYCSYIWKCLA